jgi:hypothetical protein
MREQIPALVFNLARDPGERFPLQPTSQVYKTTTWRKRQL